MNNLFSKKENVFIKKIDLPDIEFQSDIFDNFKNLILSNESKYPNIDIWLKEKVIPGIKTSNRSAYIGYINDKPIASAVVKREQNAKICHLKIGEELQDYGLGDIFFSLMIFDVIKIAKNIHFTLPEELWQKENQFFKSFGFNNVVKSKIQYRNGEDELLCSSPYDVIHQKVLNNKLPKLFYHYSIGGYSNDVNLILSIQPKYMDKIVSGEKTVEIRRSFSTKWLGSKAALYSTSPNKEIIGYTTLRNIVYDTPENIWNKYSQELGVDKNTFDQYVENKGKIYAIELDDTKKYLNGIPISQIEGILKKELHIPQSHISINVAEDWYKGISISTLLHSMHSQFGIKHTSFLNRLNSILNTESLVNID